MYLGVIIFDSVQFLLKNNNQTKNILKKTKTESKPTGFGLVWLGFWAKTGSNQNISF
jgi:hypothetical protein